MVEKHTRPTRQRLQVVDASARMVRLGLNRGTSGNVSVRWGDGFMITPSGMPPSAIHPENVVLMDMDGIWNGPSVPSSEWQLHRDIYQARPEINAVVHCHPAFCVTLAVLHKAIPQYHYMVAKAGGHDIRCADYATYGTAELSAKAMEALEGRLACLLANHGMVAMGKSLDAAVDLAVEVEELAEGYWRALQVGEPVLLPDAEMDKVLKKFETYGKNAQPAKRS